MCIRVWLSIPSQNMKVDEACNHPILMPKLYAVCQSHAAINHYGKPSKACVTHSSAQMPC